MLSAAFKASSSPFNTSGHPLLRPHHPLLAPCRHHLTPSYCHVTLPRRPLLPPRHLLAHPTSLRFKVSLCPLIFDVLYSASPWPFNASPSLLNRPPHRPEVPLEMEWYPLANVFNVKNNQCSLINFFNWLFDLEDHLYLIIEIVVPTKYY